MKNLDLIAEELFNKIRGRFPSITIGNENGEVTNVPSEARFYDFDYKESGKTLGKVSVTLTDSSIAVMYSNDFVTNEDQITKDKWYNFLRELRTFAKKRLLNFDTRDITKSNLDVRDYKFLATNRPGDITMESKMYGTNKTSYQNVGNARVTIKHTQPVNTESATGRIQNVGAIYIESAEGERFKYPFKHLNGARAMARHVSEGGKPFDDFGQHITSLSEELGKLKKFKSYVNRSSVMAEGLGGYVDVVNERIAEVKKTIERLQKESYYKESFAGFEKPVLEEVPDEVAENWIDQLTVKQFNEELKDVFPYIYRLVGEATRARELGPDDLVSEMDPAEQDFIYTVKPGDTVSELAQKLGIAVEDIVEINGLNNENDIRAGQQLRLPGDPDAEQIGAGGTRELAPNGQMDGSTRGYNPPPQNIGAGGTRELGPNGRMTGSTRGINPGESFEEHMNTLMGQFGEDRDSDNFTASDINQLQTLPAVRAKELALELINNQGRRALKPRKQVYFSQRIAAAKSTIEVMNIMYQMLLSGEGHGVIGSSRSTDRSNYRRMYDDINSDGEQKTPLPEFILSYFDRNTGQFPKGETAVLTMVEKDYGEQFIEPAKKFIEMVNNRMAEMYGYRDTDTEVTDQVQSNSELESIKSLAGLR